MRLFPFSSAKLTTVTYTANSTVTIPSNVSKLAQLVGKGQDGTPATPGYYDPNISHSTYVTSCRYQGGTGGTYSGTIYWSSIQGNGKANADKINTGSDGDITRIEYTQYDTTYSQNIVKIHFTNPVPGSAYFYYSDGWKTSNTPVVPGDYAFEYVAWQEYGSYHPGSPATTGASATGFGKTFPGGVGSPATEVVYNDVAVTPGGTYSLVVPSGGYIKISYYA